MTLAELESASREDLKAYWKNLYDTSTPSGLSQAMLTRILAYEVQSLAGKGLSKRTRQRLAVISKGGTAPSKPLVQTRPGTRLVREWNGITHVVDVTETGFLYRGENFASLSAIARRITGAHWSGPRFFGLNNRKHAA